MITREIATKLYEEKKAQIREERAKSVINFCDETATPIIEERAKSGEDHAVISCNTEWAEEIAARLHHAGGFEVRIDPINSRNSQILVKWAE